MTLTHHHLSARSGQTRSLVVLLHGFGSAGAAMLSLARVLSAALPDTAFVAPDAPERAPGRPGGRMWFTIPKLDELTIAGLVPDRLALVHVRIDLRQKPLGD